MYSLEKAAEIREHLDSITERFSDAPWLLLLVIFFECIINLIIVSVRKAKSNKFSLSSAQTSCKQIHALLARQDPVELLL